MRRRTMMVAMVFAITAVAALWNDVWAADNRRQNYSSHDPQFFKDLLSGRVWVLHRPDIMGLPADGKVLWAHYHYPDGKLRSCQYKLGKYRVVEAKWDVERSENYRSVFTFKTSRSTGRSAVFYNQQTGGLDTENFLKGKWVRASIGWVQESWPRVLKEACPKLDLPANLPINERQTAAKFVEFAVQDRDAALRGVASAEPLTPGGTGMAAAKGKHTFPAAALKQFLIENNGRVLVDFKGVRHVLALNGKRNELWRLDDAGAIADIGYLVPSADGKTIELQYEEGSETYTYFVGFALPWLPTGERFAAMAMMDWIVAEGKEVTLPYLGREGVVFRFDEGRRLTAREPDGMVREGEWLWSRGQLQVTFAEDDKANAYRWHELAAHVGWTPGK